MWRRNAWRFPTRSRPSTARFSPISFTPRSASGGIPVAGTDLVTTTSVTPPGFRPARRHAVSIRARTPSRFFLNRSRSMTRKRSANDGREKARDLLRRHLRPRLDLREEVPADEDGFRDDRDLGALGFPEKLPQLGVKSGTVAKRKVDHRDRLLG